MKLEIKRYSHSDFENISSWWMESTGMRPTSNMMIEDGTFILTVNNIEALCLTVLLTQSKDMAYLFAFIKNPFFKNIDLEECGQVLWNHCFDYAKSKGYTQVLCFTDNEKLKEKYKRFGMTPTVNNLTGFIKEVA